MGKRRHSDKDDEDYITYKIKKLERKLLKRGRHRHRRCESSEPGSPPRHDSCESSINIQYGQQLESEPENAPGDLLNPQPCLEDSVNLNTAPASPPPPPPPTTVKEPVPSSKGAGPTPISVPLDQVVEPPPILGLDNELLEILGTDPSLTKTYGKDIQTDLAERFQHIATTGLTKDLRKELLEKYLPPANCTLIDAPELNPEVRAAVSEAVLKRDKGIELKQKQLASALTCLGDALTLLLASKNKEMPVIKLLMDASRLICDCQNADSAIRRNFVFYNLKKEMKDQLQKTKIDKFLFGTDLSETLKAAKAIVKSGADLKSAPATKTPSQTVKKTNPSTQKPLNWKAPPPDRRPRGNPRAKYPAQKNQHANSSRTSSQRTQRYTSRR